MISDDEDEGLDDRTSWTRGQKKRRRRRGEERKPENDNRLDGVDAGSREKTRRPTDTSPGLTEIEDTRPQYVTYRSEPDVPFVRTPRQRLGMGNEAEVEEVLWNDKRNRKPLGRKVFNWGTSVEMEDKVLNEVKAMKLCRRHRHVVEYVSLYLLLMGGAGVRTSFMSSCCLVLTATWANSCLTKASIKVDNVQRAVVLQRAPGCLIQAMQFYTRKASIIHDFCSQKLLVHGPNILIADFGESSLLSTVSWAIKVNTGVTEGMTPELLSRMANDYGIPQWNFPSICSLHFPRFPYITRGVPQRSP